LRDPDCQTEPDFFSVKVGTGCRDYVYCENGILIATMTCDDGFQYNGMYCDRAEEVDCAFDIPTTAAWKALSKAAKT
jgi:hypothetical protein